MAKKYHEVVYNTNYGGYALSEKAIKLYKEYGGTGTSEWDIERHDPILVQVVKELGCEAEGRFARLNIAVIRGSRYYIDDYDGWETVKIPKHNKNYSKFIVTIR